MKLYDIPRNTYIKIVGDSEEDVFLFHHIDGMYSFCTDMAGNVIHLAAWTDIEIVENAFTASKGEAHDKASQDN